MLGPNITVLWEKKSGVKICAFTKFIDRIEIQKEGNIKYGM